MAWQPDEADRKSIGKQYYITEQDGILMIRCRNAFTRGQVQENSLFLLSGNTAVGKAAVFDSHIHMSSVEPELHNLQMAGFYVTKSRTLLKNLNRNCEVCKILRREREQVVMGPQHMLAVAAGQGPQLWYLDSDPGCCSWTVLDGSSLAAYTPLPRK